MSRLPAGGADPFDAMSCRLPSNAVWALPVGRLESITSPFECWRDLPVQCCELQAPVGCHVIPSSHLCFRSTRRCGLSDSAQPSDAVSCRHPSDASWALSVSWFGISRPHPVADKALLSDAMRPLPSRVVGITRTLFHCWCGSPIQCCEPKAPFGCCVTPPSRAVESLMLPFESVLPIAFS